MSPGVQGSSRILSPHEVLSLLISVRSPFAPQGHLFAGPGHPPVVLLGDLYSASCRVPYKVPQPSPGQAPEPLRMADLRDASRFSGGGGAGFLSSSVLSST